MKTFKLICLLALALAVLIWTTGGTGATVASRAYSWIFPAYEQKNVTYTIKCGDTLYGIAQAYAVHQDRWDDLRGIVMDIQQANGISDGDTKWLVPGRKLIVPLQNEVKK